MFLVGLLNTLLVSALCIVFASILGFLLASLACQITGCCESCPPFTLRRSVISRRCCRFFWYFAVLRNLPGPRQAVDAFDLFFLSNRGLYIPSPELAEGIYAFIAAIIIALALSAGLFRYNRKHQIKTGQLRKTWPIAALLIIGLPLLTHWLLVPRYTGTFAGL